MWTHVSALAGLVSERYAVHKKVKGVGDDEDPQKVVYVFACTSCVSKHNMSAEAAEFVLRLCILQSIP